MTGGLEGADEPGDDGDGGVEGLLVVAGKDLDLMGEGVDAVVAGAEEQAFASHSCGEVNGAAVFSAASTFSTASSCWLGIIPP